MNMCVIKGFGPKVIGVLFFFLAFASNAVKIDVPTIAVISKDMNNSLLFIMVFL